MPTQIWSASYAHFSICLFNKPPTGHFYDVKKRYFQKMGAYVVVSNTKEYHRKKIAAKRQRIKSDLNLFGNIYLGLSSKLRSIISDLLSSRFQDFLRGLFSNFPVLSWIKNLERINKWHWRRFVSQQLSHTKNVLTLLSWSYWDKHTG